MHFVGRTRIDEEAGGSIDDDGVGRIDIDIDWNDDAIGGDSDGLTASDGSSILDIDGVWCLWLDDGVMISTDWLEWTATKGGNNWKYVEVRKDWDFPFR